MADRKSLWRRKLNFRYLRWRTLGLVCKIWPHFRQKLHFFDQPVFPEELEPVQSWEIRRNYPEPFTEETQTFLKTHCRSDDFGRLKKPLHNLDYWQAPVTVSCRYSLLNSISFYDRSGLLVHSDSGRVVVDGPEFPNWKQCKPARRSQLEPCPYENIIPVRRYSNYSHFLLDCGVPLLAFLMKYEKERNQFAIATASNQPAFATQFLEKLASHFQLELLTLNPNSYLQASRTLAFEVEGPCSTWTPASPDLANELRALFQQPGTTAATRKVFLHRKGAKWRNLENSDELIPLLEQNGFEVFTPDSTNFLAQVKLMSETTLLVSGHGAALTNMLFMPQGGTVLEIFPAEFQLSCYPALAGFLGLNYHHLIGQPTGSAQNYTLPSSDLLEKITLLTQQ